MVFFRNMYFERHGVLTSPPFAASVQHRTVAVAALA